MNKIDEQIEALKQSDKAFARWFRKLPNKTTQRDYFGCFIPILRSLSLTPQEFLDQYRQQGNVHDDLIDRLEENLNKLKEIHFSLTVQTHASLISFLKHNGVILGAAAFEIPAPKRETIEPQYIPTDDEFDKWLRFAQKPRGKFSLAFFRYAGPRVGAVDDPVPMTLRHVVDLDLEAVQKGEIKFKQETSCGILIYASFKGEEIIRTPETYVSFLLPRGMQLLKDYLEDRLRKGEKLTPESFLFRTYENGKAIDYVNKHRMCTLSSRACKAAGFVIKVKNPETGKEEEKAKYTIHSLRRLFYNSMSGVEDVDKEALMGHVKGVKARYHGTVDDLMKAVEFMRQKYEFGMRVITGLNDEEIRSRALLDFAKTLGISNDRIAQIQATLGQAASIDDLREALSKELDHLAFHATDGGTPYASKIVNEGELLDFVNAGWDVVKELSNGKIVVRTTLRAN